MSIFRSAFSAIPYAVMIYLMLIFIAIFGLGIFSLNVFDVKGIFFLYIIIFAYIQLFQREEGED